MKKILFLLGVALVISINVNKADALQQIQTIVEDTCGIKACPGGSVQCCTDPQGNTWYKHP